MKVAIILCGALGREVVAIVKRQGWEVGLFGISAQDHSLPQRIAPHVEHKLRALIPQYERVIVAYGDCGTGGQLDAVLQHYNVPRLAGPHCYEMYGGAVHDQAMAEQPGTFFLTDFLVRGFDGTVWKTLGLKQYPELQSQYFANYTRVVYLQQTERPDFVARAEAIAQRLNLPLELRNTGYGALETRLMTLMNEIGAEQYQPVLPETLIFKDNPPALQTHIKKTPRPRRGQAAAVSRKALAEMS